MATNPAFASTPRLSFGQVGTPNTTRNGTGAIADIFLGATNGSRIDRVRICAIESTTAGVIRLYIDDNSTVKLFREILVPAITASVSVAVFQTEIVFEGGLLLPDGSNDLQASTHIGETFNIFAWGGDF